MTKAMVHGVLALGLAMGATFYSFISEPLYARQASGASAASSASTPKVEGSNIKVEYGISGTGTTVTTTYKKAPTEVVQMTSEWLLPRVSKALSQWPQVTAISHVADTITPTEERSQWSDAVTFTRKYGLFVNLSLPAQVSLLFEVEENHQKCEPRTAPAATVVSDGGPGDDVVSTATTTSCSLSAMLKISGPVAIYGSIVDRVFSDAILRDNQDLQFRVSTSWAAKDDIMLTSQFNIKRPSFERGLSLFFDSFGVWLPKDTQSQRNLWNRNRLLLGVSRIMRQTNENVLQPKVVGL